MTVCVAALCENGNAIVIAADKMIGMGYVEGEPDISKQRKLHKDCWVLFAGEDITPVFDIIDYAREILEKDYSVEVNNPAPLHEVMKSVEKGFEKKRTQDAERLYLSSTGWTLERFNREGHQILPNAAQIQADIDRFRPVIQLLVIGFDDNGVGYVFGLDGYGDAPGIAKRLDIPGFHSIGSGSTVATFMLYYRHMSPKIGAREGLYYVLEAKYYGEQASGVGPSTDLFIAKPGQELVPVSDEKIIEKKLIPICSALEPKSLRKRDRETLNGLAELQGFNKIKEPSKRRKKKLIVVDTSMSVSTATMRLIPTGIR
jgi:20S proteasome alpha/beta subunit